MRDSPALCGLMILVAAALRLGDLAGEPLGPAEAASTWPAWAAATGWLPGPPPLGDGPASPLLFAGQRALFWIAGGGGDALARAWPAALGTILVLVPWLMRPVIGREATLTLVGLLAVDPVLVRSSRTADGAIASSLCALLVVACLVRWRADTAESADGEGGRRRWLEAAAVCLGTLVASGPLAWSLLLLLGAVAAGASMDGGARVAGARGPRPGGSSRPAGRLVGAAIAGAVLAATAGLTHWGGLQGVSVSLTAWLGQWPGEPGFRAPGRLLQGLVVEQPLLLALGALGLATEWRRASATPWRRRMTLLSVCGLAATLGRLPLTLLLVLAAARAAGVVPAWRARLDGRPRAWFVASVLALLFLLTLRHAVPKPPVGDAEGARLLASDVTSLCAWQGLDPRECQVEAVADPWADPLLAWHLRDLGRLRWVLSPPLDLSDQTPRPPRPPRSLIITPVDTAGSSMSTAPGRGPEGYAGSRYRLRRAGAAHDLVTLWVPRDLGGAGGAPEPPLVDRPPPSHGGAW